MSNQPRPAGAAFLSYASQDKEAAERICEALRDAGIEVWFDRSELRGGDAWDAQIRKRIHECALFLPIVSTHTDARSEGYFRREWNLASRRLLDMAFDTPFLLPVVIDATLEAEARVPEEFLGVQWTRLPNGNTNPDFVERVSQLLSGIAAERKVSSANAHSAAQASTAHLIEHGRSRMKLRAVGAASMALALALAAGIFWYHRVERGTSAEPAKGDTPLVSATLTSEKSIAVLPFTDMSERRDQEYFADGLADELIDHLAQTTELKVIARTSSFAFKGKNEDARSIARKLGVTNLLQGSVRKAGNELRITTQLIQATDGALIWSDTYVRKLDDVFIVQNEISTMVAKALNAKLVATPAAGAQPAEGTTSNLQAYDLLLQGNYYYLRGHQGDDTKAIEIYQQALKLDPQYAVAWAKLARAYAWQGNSGDLSATEAEAKGRNAVNRALAIDSNCAEAYFARGHIHRFLSGEWLAAISDYQRAASLDPHGVVGDGARGSTAILGMALSGEFDRALDWFRQRIERSPMDTEAMFNQANSLRDAGRLQESAATFVRLLELNSTFVTAHANYALTLLLMNKSAAALAALEQESDDASRLMVLAVAHFAAGQRTESDLALNALKHGFADRKAYQIAAVYAYRGETDEAFTWLDRAYRERTGSLESLKINPLFRKLHGDPQFDALLRKAKLSDRAPAGV